jgi:hypothetical protein
MKKLAPPQQRLQQNDSEVGSCYRQRHTRQPGATADVHYPIAAIEKLADGRGVQQVPVPQSVNLTRSDQSAFDTSIRQPLDVPLRKVETRPEDRGCGISHCGVP